VDRICPIEFAVVINCPEMVSGNK